MIRIKCSKCEKKRWARAKHSMADLSKHLCKPCKRKMGILPMAHQPKFKRTGPRAKPAALPKPDKKEKKKR